jgi:6-phosphogluconolactonase
LKAKSKMHSTMSSSATKLAVAAIAVAIGAYAVQYFAAQQQKKKAQKDDGDNKFDVNTYPDKATLADAVCTYVAKTAKAAIDERGVFHLTVAGGSLLDSLAGLVKHKDTVDFSKVLLSFANHKCVAPSDEGKSNLAKCKKKFATVAGITSFVEPTRAPVVDGDGSSEAEFYAKALKDAGIPHKDGFPVVDLILLGLGGDGHVGSNHPMGPAVAESTKSVAASPKTGQPASITFTIETMNSARQVALVVAGGSKGKKEAVKRAMVRPAESPRGAFPAQLLQDPILFLDAEAAAEL